MKIDLTVNSHLSHVYEYTQGFFMDRSFDDLNGKYEILQY